MLDIVLRPRVFDELEKIADLTIAEWGETRARTYFEDIRRQIDRAAEFPGMGSSVHGLPPEYRKIRTGSHRIIYRRTATELIVVRIIHERQDVTGEADGL